MLTLPSVGYKFTSQGFRVVSACVHAGTTGLCECLPVALGGTTATPELRRLQAELSARHSYREAARLLATLLPRDPMSHATMRHRRLTIRHIASEVAYPNGEKFRPAVAKRLWKCDDRRRCLANNTGSLITTAGVTAPSCPSQHPGGRLCRRDCQCSNGQEAADEMVAAGRTLTARRSTARQLPALGSGDGACHGTTVVKR
jgi:hypothetical protein